MDLTWCLYRLREMTLRELLKRIGEYLTIYHTQIKYRNPKKWSYGHFARDDTRLVFHPMPGTVLPKDRNHYAIYDYEFDLTKPLDWYFTGNTNVRWPNCHYAKINYRPGNPYGNVRINWESNRLQFLPAMAITDEELAKTIISDWLEKNPYLHGPSYLSSMEVSLRWAFIYWAVCLFKEPLDESFIKSLAGLAIASGKFIENHLSTHSSAGNHLIVEAVGLTWIGKALQDEKISKKWLVKARNILWEQTIRQLNPDGTNKEQSFWYLGFVLDALFHYFLVEDRELIPDAVWERVEKACKFVHEIISSDGSFPDYGDRDDGFVFRLGGAYKESPFPGLLNTGAIFFDRPDWYRNSPYAAQCFEFWSNKSGKDSNIRHTCDDQPAFSEKPVIRSYPNGGMTLMKWSKGRLLFRHAQLGLEPTYGHGHADALSILFYWDNTPVLIDLGSGQYNGNQAIRNFFRSTIAHNTIEIGGTNQANILGPFLWDKSYETCLTRSQETPLFLAEAYHTGYKNKLGIIHSRRIEWPEPNNIEIKDTFSGPGGIKCKGAFHLSACRRIIKKENLVEAYFDDFTLSLTFPPNLTIEVRYGSVDPFIGWRSTVYGKWEPIHSIVFFFEIAKNYNSGISLQILEN